MFDTNTPKRIQAKLLFLICALIGAVCFIGIYGVGILDFTNTGWLFNNDHDLRQHYIGWCRYRSDPWHFPIGLIDSLSYPNSMSVIYTDSIPLFAVIFKIVSPLLPQSFQYFGLFGILSFMLMGGFAALLLRRFIASDLQCIIGSVFYVLSAPVIQRMYFHTALAAQWIIIAAMVLWVYNDIISSDRKRILYWGILGFLCVGIHSYFLPMVGMVLAVLVITQFAKKKGYIAPIGELVAFCAAGLINLYILGAFYGGMDASGPGLGTFGSNLNTFINPWEIGQLLPELPLQNYFQYEGMAYLGAGIILLFIIVAAGLVFRRVRKIPEEAFHSDPIYGRMTILLVALSVFFAVMPTISWGDAFSATIPYPGFVAMLLGIFRSNGRLIWPAMYVLMTVAISTAAYTFRHYKVATIVIFAALVLQICDMSNAFASRFELYTSQYPVETIWDDPDVSKFIEGKNEFIFLYTENDLTMMSGYYGYLHNMRQNNFYFARDIDGSVREVIDGYYAELNNKNIRDNAVYVIKTEEYQRDSAYYDGLGADMMEIADHMLFTSR